MSSAYFISGGYGREVTIEEPLSAEMILGFTVCTIVFLISALILIIVSHNAIARKLPNNPILKGFLWFISLGPFFASIIVCLFFTDKLTPAVKETNDVYIEYFTMERQIGNSRYATNYVSNYYHITFDYDGITYVVSIDADKDIRLGSSNMAILEEKITTRGKTIRFKELVLTESATKESYADLTKPIYITPETE